MTWKPLQLCLVAAYMAAKVWAAAPIPFEHALETLVQNHENWNLEKARLETLRKQNSRYDFIFLPELGLTASHRSDQRLTRSMGIILNPDQLKTEQSAGLTLNWNLFHGGADRASQLAADLEVERQSSKAQDTYLTAEQESTNILFRYLQSAQEKKAYERVTERTLQILGGLGDQSRSGTITSEQKDRHTLEVRLAQTRLADATVQFRSQQGKLKGFLGDAPVSERWPWKEALLHCISPCGLGEFTETPRPDVRAAAQSVALAEQRAKEARGKLFGSLDLSLSFSYTNLITDERKGTEWGGQLIYRLPLFDQLENLSQYHGAIESRKGAEIQTALLKRKTRSDFEAALSGFKEALQTARERERDRELIERILDAESRRYRKGIMALEELGHVLDRSVNVLLASARAWYVTHQQLVSLCHSTGRKVAECIPHLTAAPVGQSVEAVSVPEEETP